MKSLILFIFFTCAWSIAPAQVNYVRNPDFEKYTSCPTNYDQIKLAKYWSSLDTAESPPSLGCIGEYCNACAPISSKVNVPFGSGYYQMAHSGYGMTMGYYFCDETPPPPAPYYAYRNYLQGRLYKNLTAGKSYCVSFYINTTERTMYVCNKMGAYLDDGSIDTVSICSKPITFVKPQVYSNDVIDDTMNWLKIEGSFVANGTERFITLGNFFPKDSVTYYEPLYRKALHQWAYYLIDDVSVIESDLKADAGADKWAEQTKKVEIGRVGDSTAIGLDCKWYHKGSLIDSGAIISVNANAIKGAIDTYIVVQNVCGNVTRDTVVVSTVGLGMQQFEAEKSFTIFPNPSSGTFTITSLRDKYSLGPSGKQSVTATVFDILGRTILQSKIQFHNKNCALNIDAQRGVYILELQDENGARWRERVVVE